MNNMDLIKQMPEMLSGKELYERLADVPVYDETIREKSQTERLMALSTLYDIYLPSEMSVEIYSKLYLALLRSLQKKGTHAAVQQLYQNHKTIMQRESRGIIGGSDSFSIVGCSGIGKSSAINRAISIITENKMIEIENPPVRIIPSNQIRCPRCGSTQITTGQRGFSFWTGFIGANKTVNRCAKCGHSWQPR